MYSLMSQNIITTCLIACCSTFGMQYRSYLARHGLDKFPEVSATRLEEGSAYRLCNWRPRCAPTDWEQAPKVSSLSSSSNNCITVLTLWHGHLSWRCHRCRGRNRAWRMQVNSNHFHTCAFARIIPCRQIYHRSLYKGSTFFEGPISGRLLVISPSFNHLQSIITRTTDQFGFRDASFHQPLPIGAHDSITRKTDQLRFRDARFQASGPLSKSFMSVSFPILARITLIYYPCHVTCQQRYSVSHWAVFVMFWLVSVYFLEISSNFH